MKKRWIFVLGSFIAIWSAAELVFDVVRGNPFELRNLVFLATGVAIALGQSREET